MKIKIKLIYLILLLPIFILLFYIPKGSSEKINGNICIVHSPSCPHCSHLLDYVSSLKTSIEIVSTTEGKRIYECLKKDGYNWDFGVPIMFTKMNGKLFIIKGFPSVTQDVDGYFMGKEYEERLCESAGGRKHEENGEYLFCHIEDNVALGNRYSVEYMIEECEKNSCEVVC